MNWTVPFASPLNVLDRRAVLRNAWSAGMPGFDRLTLAARIAGRAATVDHGRASRPWCSSKQNPAEVLRSRDKWTVIPNPHV